MAAGTEYREESISDIPDDQFQRGLIFGTEAVSAAGVARHLGSVRRVLGAGAGEPGAESRGTLRRLQRLRRYDQSEGRRALGADRDAGVARFVGHGLPRAIARADRPRTFAGVAVLHRHLSAATPACRARARRSTTTSFSPATRTWTPRNRRHSTSASHGKPTDRIELTLDYWDIKQENKIDEVPFGFIYDELLRHAGQRLSACAAHRCRARRSVPLQTINRHVHQYRRAERQRHRPRRLLRLRCRSGHADARTRLLAPARVRARRAEPGGHGVRHARARGRVRVSGGSRHADRGLGHRQLGCHSRASTTSARSRTRRTSNFDGMLDYDTNDTRDVECVHDGESAVPLHGLRERAARWSASTTRSTKSRRSPSATATRTCMATCRTSHNPRGRFWNAKAIFRF